MLFSVIIRGLEFDVDCLNRDYRDPDWRWFGLTESDIARYAFTDEEIESVNSQVATKLENWLIESA